MFFSTDSNSKTFCKSMYAESEILKAISETTEQEYLLYFRFSYHSIKDNFSTY